MNKDKLLLILICLFLVHATVATSSNIGTSPLRLNQKVSPIETSQALTFLKEFNVLTFALGLYQLDARERLSKAKIKEKMTLDSTIWEREFGISFDLDNIDFKRKGFTRYYPFTVNGKDFIIRIFDVREKHRMPKFEVFCEGIFEDSKIGFQIIPGVKTILKSKRIKKIPFPRLVSYPTYP